MLACELEGCELRGSWAGFLGGGIARGFCGLRKWPGPSGNRHVLPAE